MAYATNMPLLPAKMPHICHIYATLLGPGVTLANFGHIWHICGICHIHRPGYTLGRCGIFVAYATCHPKMDKSRAGSHIVKKSLSGPETGICHKYAINCSKIGLDGSKLAYLWHMPGLGLHMGQNGPNTGIFVAYASLFVLWGSSGPKKWFEATNVA